MFTQKRFSHVPGDDVNQDVGAPGDALFSLSAVRGRGAAAALVDAAAPAEAELDEMEADSDAARELVLPEAPGSSASDTEDERCGICFSSKVHGNPAALIVLTQTLCVAARELVLPEAPGSSASDTENERCDCEACTCLVEL